MNSPCYRLLIALCLALSPGANSADAAETTIENISPPGWAPFYGFDGSFHVQVPALPTIHSEHSEAGTQVIYRFQTKDKVWVISVVDLNEPIPDALVGELLMQSAKGAAAGFPGTLDSQELTQILGCPGIRFRISGEAAYLHVFTLFLGQRTYSVARIGQGKSPHWDADDPVFHSFRLREFDLAGFRAERDYFMKNGVQTLFLKALDYRSRKMLSEVTNVWRVGLFGAFEQFGADSADTSMYAGELGRILAQRNHYDEAVACLEMALKIQHKVLGPLDKATISTHGTLGWVYRNMSAFEESQVHIEQQLAAERKVFGENSPEVAATLYGLAKTVLTKGLFAESRKLAEQSLAIFQALPDQPTDNALAADQQDKIAAIHDLFGDCDRELGNFDKARANLQKALDIREKLYGRDGILTAKTRHGMGILDLITGDYVSAQANISAALEVFEKTQGELTIFTLECRSDLANAFIALGDLDAANQELLRVLAGRKKLFPGPNQMVAAVLSDLAFLELDRGNPEKTLEYANAAYEIDTQIKPDEHPQLGVVFSNMAMLFLQLQQWQLAEQAFARSLDVLRQRIGDTHTRMLPPLLGLGQAALEQQQFARAEEHFSDALKLAEKLLGPDAPFTSLALRSLGELSERRDDPAKAADYYGRARQAATRFVHRQLSALSEPEQLRFLSSEFQPTLQASVAFSLRNRHLPRVARSSVEWLVNAKAITVEVLTEQSRLRKSASDPRALGLVDKLANIRAAMARSFLNSGTSEDTEITRTLHALAERERETVQELVAEGVAAAGVDQWVSFAGLQNSLRSRSAFVDIFRVQNPGPQSVSKYVAWVVKPAGAPTIVELGDASTVDQQISALQAKMEHAVAEIVDVGEKEADERLRSALLAVSETVLRPLLEPLADTTHLVISPDSRAWLIPWDALLLPDGRYAVEAFEIRLALSGRDLLAKATSAQPTGPPVIVADPDFGRPSPDQRSRPAGPPIVSRLPGTAREADAVKNSLQQLAGLHPVEMRRGAAREERIKALQRPHTILFATHGFFLNQSESRAAGQDNPLLRCGLMLAGSNTGGRGGKEDGILTGIEVLGLDLRGTRLVVLSACDTGLGKTRTGEGVSGLRQAFQLAGANAVVASLWQAPDTETAKLMSSFFQGLADGAEAPQALRDAKLERIRDRRRTFGVAHPVFWSAFGITGRIF